MSSDKLLLGLGAMALSGHLFAADLLLQHVEVYDGTGKPPFPADVRIQGDRIKAVGAHLKSLPGEEVRDEKGLSLAPGFIDGATGSRDPAAPVA